MARKKQKEYVVRGLFDEDQVLQILGYHTLYMRGYSSANINKIALMTVQKNVKNANPERQFRVEITLNGKPKLL